MKQFNLSVIILLLFLLLMNFTPEEKTVKLKQSFNTFPMQYNEWSSTEHPFEKDVLDILKLDDYMNRNYVSENENVWLYVGYYSSQKNGATYHSPKNCLPGGGWQIIDSQPYTINFNNAAQNPIVINKLLIQKGLDKQLVFYWYQDRGRIIQSEYMAKVYLLNDSIFQHRSDGSMVRVIVNFKESQEKAEASGDKFIKEFFPLINDYLPGTTLL